jgi:Tfp pilus assembly protein PilN
MKALTQVVAQRKVSPELAAEVDNAKATIAARKEVIEVLDSGALGRTSGFSAFMTGFARLAQPDLWLTGFSIASGGDEIEIRGRMLDASRLPDYVQRLNSVPIFQGRRFAALEMQRVTPVELPESSAAVAPTAEGQAVVEAQKLPRQVPFVEFLLRSENAGRGDASTRAKEAS